MYLGVFGREEIKRRRYMLEDGKNYYPFDDYIGFPVKQYSNILMSIKKTPHGNYYVFLV